MDMNVLMQMITNVGIPSVVCGACMWYVREQNKDARAEREQMNKDLGSKISDLNENIIKLIALETATKYSRKVENIDDHGD